MTITQSFNSLQKSAILKIIEILWRIIYSDGNADIYETNLMRRLTGLLYLDSRTVGQIKQNRNKLNEI